MLIKISSAEVRKVSSATITLLFLAFFKKSAMFFENKQQKLYRKTIKPTNANDKSGLNLALNSSTPRMYLGSFVPSKVPPIKEKNAF